MIYRSHLPQVCVQSQQISETASLGYRGFSFLAFRFSLRQGSSLMSRLIGQTFAFNAAQQFLRAISVVHAKRDAIAVPEVEFGNIAVQMIGCAMLIDAFHAALEDGEESFNG